jgi:hypothetical protein
VAQRNDRPAGAIRRTEFGLQVRLLQLFVFNYLQNSGSHCDARVTRLNSSGRKLVFACLRIAFRIRPEKRQTTLHHRRNSQNLVVRYTHCEKELTIPRKGVVCGLLFASSADTEGDQSTTVLSMVLDAGIGKTISYLP